MEEPSIFEFLQPIHKVEKDSGYARTSTEKFERFDELNPHVYQMILQVTRQLQAKGFKNAGMKMIFERLRWLWAMQTQGEDYKLNNNYTAFYARKVMRENPDLEGFFKVRAQRSRE